MVWAIATYPEALFVLLAGLAMLAIASQRLLIAAVWRTRNGDTIGRRFHHDSVTSDCLAAPQECGQAHLVRVGGSSLARRFDRLRDLLSGTLP